MDVTSWQKHFAPVRACVRELTIVLWLCALPIGAVVAFLLIITGVAQGIDLTEAFMRAEALSKALTGVSYLYFATCVTVAAASALAEIAPTLLSRLVPWWVLLGSLGTGIPVIFPHVVVFGTALCIYVGILIVAWVFLALRRIDSQLIPAIAPRHWMRPAEVALAIAGLLLCIAFLVSNVALPRAIGTVGVVYFGFGWWTLLLTLVLVVWPRRVGLPALTLVALGLVLFCATRNDNHAFHGCEVFEFQNANGSDVAQPWCTGGWLQKAPAQRPQWFADHVKTWLQANCRPVRPTDLRSCPMVFVAAEGGGARAAYWTASVLQRLNERSSGAFAKHLFAISSVSGGTLGSVGFLGSVFHPGQPPQRLRQFAGGDFLSPIIAALLFPEMIQRILPWPVDAFDRSHAFEHSLEVSWKQAYDDDAFADDFMGFWSPQEERTGPAMFINTTNVETGIPFVVSNLDVPRILHPRSYYAFDNFETSSANRDAQVYQIRSLPMSAAVHLSGRFSYVNPPATLDGLVSSVGLGVDLNCDLQQTCDRKIVPWGRLVDGGYYDGTGADTLRDVLLAAKATVDHLRLPFVVQYEVIVITNEPDLSFDPDPSYDASVIPFRPHEPGEVYLRKVHGIAAQAFYGNLPRQASLTVAQRGRLRAVQHQVFDRHVGVSDLTAPTQTYYMVGGNHSNSDQAALAQTTGQLALETTQECFAAAFPRAPVAADPLFAAAKAHITGLAQWQRCSPEFWRRYGVGSTEENFPGGCASNSVSALVGSSPLSEGIFAVARPSAALACVTLANFQKLSYARVAAGLSLLDPQADAVTPPLGWVLSPDAKTAMDIALERAFAPGDRGYHFGDLAETVRAYAQPAQPPLQVLVGGAPEDDGPADRILVAYDVSDRTKLPASWHRYFVNVGLHLPMDGKYPTCPTMVVSQTRSDGAARYYRLSTGYCQPRPR